MNLCVEFSNSLIGGFKQCQSRRKKYDSESSQANEYLQLAKNVTENDNFVIPSPLGYDEREELMMEFGVLA